MRSCRRLARCGGRGLRNLGGQPASRTTHAAVHPPHGHREPRRHGHDLWTDSRPPARHPAAYPTGLAPLTTAANAERRLGQR
jgi:hypothetical protein